MSFTPDPKPKAPSQLHRFLKTLPLLLGLGGIVALGYLSVGYQARYIPAGSMTPTLQIGDRLFIHKLAYLGSLPQRSDIVVFAPTDALVQQNFHDAFIKRIIGLPGENVSVKQGKVLINGKPLTENYIEEAPQYEMAAKQVPANSYFVLGDNRNNSYDSHYWGFVPEEKIIGKAVYRFYPFDRMGAINKP
jgi:signal peptidase I